MVRLSFLKQERSSDKFLTIDIGSSSVKVFAFKVDESGGTPKVSVIGKSKESLLVDSTRSGVIVDMENLEHALEVAIAEASGEEKISDVIFGVGGNLAIGIMVTVKVRRSNTSKIQEGELREIFDRIHKEAYSKIDEVFLELTGDTNTNLDHITFSVVYKKLDNEIVDKLEGKEGGQMEIAMFASFSPEHHLRSLKELSKRLKLNTLAVSSGMYTLAKSLSFSKEPDFDGVLVDVGGEFTDVAIVFRGGIVATKSLDIGAVHFTKCLSREMDLDFEDAEKKKLEYSYGRLKEEEEFEVRSHMDDLLDVWADGLELLFHQFTGVKKFPSKVYLIGGGAELPDLFEVTSREPWTKSVPFKSPPEFSRINIKDLPLIEDSMGQLNSFEDIVPASLSIVYLEQKGLIK